MPPPVPIVDGPFDGGHAANTGVAYRWISREGGHGKPGPGRYLYARRYRPSRYVYAGEEARLCPGCGAIYTAVGSKLMALTCHLCGGGTEPANDWKKKTNNGGKNGAS